jgi:hypothetical protein
MMALIEAAEAVGYWKRLSRNFPNNVASRALMRSCSARSTAGSLPPRDRNISPMVSPQTTVRIGLAASGMRQAMIARTSQLPKPWRPGFEKTGTNGLTIRSPNSSIAMRSESRRSVPRTLHGE